MMEGLKEASRDQFPRSGGREVTGRRFRMPMSSSLSLQACVCMYKYYYIQT